MTTAPRLVGTWTEADRAALTAGLEAVRAALAGVASDETISGILSGIKFVSKDDIPFYELAQENRIYCRPGHVTPRIVAHAIGHMIAIQLENAPLMALSTETITLPDGSFLSGRKPGGGFDRDGELASPENGFLSEEWRDEGQIHPESLAGGEKPVELWCDLFMNWVFGTFADNEAGRVLYQWVTEHLEKWLKKGE